MPKLTNNDVALLKDPTFSIWTIQEFCADKLNITAERIADVLFNALPADKQTPENQSYINKSLNYKVNASGATIIFVNTNQGLHLVYGNSPRRKRVVSHNGSCNKGESMELAALREFSEELGNPKSNGILCRIVNQPKYQSLGITNRIGEDAQSIALQIVNEKANPNTIYFNMSLIYVNDKPVNYKNLCDEINEINRRIGKVSNEFYMPAVSFIYGDRVNKIGPANFSDAEKKAAAVALINAFKNHPESITANFKALFDNMFTVDTEINLIKEALLAIIDLTETNELGLVNRNELEELLSSDVNNIDKQGYFKPSFKNLLVHRGDLSVKDFLNKFEVSPSLASSMTLGFASTNKAGLDPHYSINDVWIRFDFKDKCIP